MPKTKAVSLSAELEQLQNAAEAARLLVEALAHDQLATERDERAALRAVAGVLYLVATRLRDLGLVVGCARDAAMVWTPQNATTATATNREEHDVRLPTRR